MQQSTLSTLKVRRTSPVPSNLQPLLSSAAQCRHIKLLCCSADDVPAELKLSASVAAGLINRHTQAPYVINRILPADQLWLASAKEDATMSGCTWVALSVVELWQLAYSIG